MKITVDLPQNHQSVEFETRLVMMDIVTDLIRNCNWDDEPVTFVVSLTDDDENPIRVDRVKPNLPTPSPTTPNLRLVH